MNALSIKQDWEGILEYATFIRETFHCQVISNISDYIMDAGYFYDTNYHLTTIGTIDHTARLIQDLQNFMGDGLSVQILEFRMRQRMDCDLMVFVGLFDLFPRETVVPDRIWKIISRCL